MLIWVIQWFSDRRTHPGTHPDTILFSGSTPVPPQSIDGMD
jgi:hypothetical protein